MTEAEENAVRETAKLYEGFMEDWERKDEIGFLHIYRFHRARWRRNDARWFSEWAYSPRLARPLLMGLIYDDYYSDRVACFYASIMLREEGCIFDPQLRQFVSTRLLNPAPPRDKRKSRNNYRDMGIASLVYSLFPQFSATRNEASRSKGGKECGCSIVSEALKRLGERGMSEDRVKKIYLKQTPLVWRQRKAPKPICKSMQ